MGCCWVNYIARIDSHHNNIFVLCPTCGQWGFIFKKSSSSCARLGVRHRNETRCAITWHPEFSKFAENIHGTIVRISPSKLRIAIRKGKYISPDYDYLFIVAPNGLSNNIDVISTEKVLMDSN